jgi:hypothetical protein
MVILRLLSYILIAATLMLLGYDAVNWLQASGAPHSLYSMGAFINTIAGSDVTGGLPSVLQTVLAWPSWAITGVIGLILAFVSRNHG